MTTNHESAIEIHAGGGWAGGEARSMAEREQEQNFYPISEIGFIGSLIDERVHDFDQLRRDLSRAQDQPHMLDDATVDRIHLVHTESLELASSFDNQLDRWSGLGTLTPGQRAEVSRLQQQMVRYRDGCQHIIAMAEGLKKDTIDAILRMSDEEVGRAVLSGELPVPGRKEKHVLPKLVVNQDFMVEFTSSKAPCFGLGLVEEDTKSQPTGFLALRPDRAIPPAVSDAGFSFGHSLLGTANFEVVYFGFQFYGFETYSVLINPNHPVTQAVLTTMVQTGDYFFFAIDAGGTATAFRSEIGEENLAGLTTNLPRILRSTTTEAQYRTAVTQFKKHPDPPSIVMSWVCRENMEYLDLTTQRLDLMPT